MDMNEEMNTFQMLDLRGLIKKLSSELEKHKFELANLEKQLYSLQYDLKKIKSDEKLCLKQFELENNETVISRISVEIDSLHVEEKIIERQMATLSEDILNYRETIQYKEHHLNIAQDRLTYLEEALASAASEDVLDRIKEGIGAKTDGEVAETLGVSKQAVYNARANGRVPDSWVRSIATKYPGISADWLFFGQASQEAMHATLDGLGIPGRSLEKLASADSEIVMVPLAEARLSAGHGSFEVSDDVKDHCPFQATFLHRKGNTAQMVVMAVSGDSMSPTIEDGDLVLIDQSQIEPVPGKIFAVSVEGMIYLKRVNAKPGQLVMTSDNEDYEPLIVDTRGDLADTVRIIGRAVWWAREA